jgi:hypothetical protein
MHIKFQLEKKNLFSDKIFVRVNNKTPAAAIFSLQYLRPLYVYTYTLRILGYNHTVFIYIYLLALLSYHWRFLFFISCQWRFFK